MAEYVVPEETVSQRLGKTGEDQEEKLEPEGRKMLAGCGYESEKARDEWIDAVERIHRFKGFEEGEMHERKRFEEVMDDGDYGLGEPPRWMLLEGI